MHHPCHHGVAEKKRPVNVIKRLINVSGEYCHNQHVLALTAQADGCRRHLSSCMANDTRQPGIDGGHPFPSASYLPQR